ncbi:MAG: class I SAM-dependent methyltransferase [Rickettsiales bacterium]
MSPLTPILRDKIAASGPISLADYMTLALSHPDHGYYMTRDPFGSRGDFITSPEISQIFGEMIGLWCVQAWQAMGGGPVSLVELGPGRGTLMADLLRATRGMGDFHNSITIHMVETSPRLAHAQYLRLRDMHPRIEWLDAMEELPANRLLLIANEFFDALPIKQFVMSAEGMRERRVDWNAETESFTFVLSEPGLALAKSGTAIVPGTVMEHSPASRGAMRHIAQQVTQHGGAALIIDYGYLGDAHHDTLQAVKSHVFHPVLSSPGEADITAHVDFETLRAIATDAGAHVQGPVNQGEFLIRLGAQLRLEMLLKQAAIEQREPLISGLQRLISPQAMGELFKVMAVTADARIETPGFGG